MRVLGHWVRRTVTYKLVWTLFAGGLWANWHCTEYRKRIHHKQKEAMEIKHKRIEDGEGIPKLAQTMIIPRTDLLVFSFVCFGCPPSSTHTHTHTQKEKPKFFSPFFLSSLVWRVFLCAAIRTTTTTSSCCCCCSLSRLFFFFGRLIAAAVTIAQHLLRACCTLVYSLPSPVSLLPFLSGCDRFLRRAVYTFNVSMG